MRKLLALAAIATFAILPLTGCDKDDATTADAEHAVDHAVDAATDAAEH